VLALLLSTASALAAAAPSAASASDGAVAPAAGRAFIRVDQLGYAPFERKIAYLLAPSASPAVEFRVIATDGSTAFTGHAGSNRGAWNAHFSAVHALRFSALRAPGVYRLVVESLGVRSAPFRIGTRSELFGPRVADTVAFFQAQRDGARVIPGTLDRQPAHLHDRNARLYDWPAYEDPDSDVIVGDSLQRLPGRADLEGGWFDAGDFIKFTHTTAYAVTLMLASARALGGDAPPTLLPEARFGLRWLRKAWDDRRGVIDFQVGIGSGNQDGTFNGDHDRWRLPEKDDSLTGPENRYLRHRPAFRANEPGTRLPPNMAGRMAAAFALAAQVDAAGDHERAAQELTIAAGLFAHAKKQHVSEADVVTALPHAFYPESSWRDDLELAAAELALAGQALGDPRSGRWLRASAR
jgi:hypothetical protein